MRKIFFLLTLCIGIQAQAQNYTVSNIIEGGKVFVDILKVFKTPKRALTSSTLVMQSATDSCSLKSIADLCYKNTSGKKMFISLFKRNGSVYTVVPLTLALINNSKECLYDIASGIYKYKIEIEDEDDDAKRVIYKEGEIKIMACDKRVEEIK